MKLPKDPREYLRVVIPLTDFERSVVDELCRRGGFVSVDDVVLAGLWQLARQLDVDVPYSAFAVGQRKGSP